MEPVRTVIVNAQFDLFFFTIRRFYVYLQHIVLITVKLLLFLRDVILFLELNFCIKLVAMCTKRHRICALAFVQIQKEIEK